MISQTTNATTPRNVLVRWATILAILLIVLLWAGWRMQSAAEQLVAAGGSPSAPGPNHVALAAAPAESVPTPKEWYRCTMPECGDVGSADPKSRCPVCGMRRERVDTGAEGDSGEFEIRMSERARRLASLETVPVQRRILHKRIRTVGTIGYDETRQKMVTAWIAGRADRLFADFTGMTVRRGDHLVELYSPELLSAQEEFLQARAAAGNGPSGESLARRTGEQLLSSARRKLELLGLTPEQVEQIASSAEPQTHLVIHAPIGGTIVRKSVMEGMYVRTGDPLYEIADLSTVWLLIEVYEADLPWIHPFQDVTVSAEAFPDETFRGRIVFVDPEVDRQTRTIRVRVNVENPQRRLKPGMFATAEILSALGPGAKAVGVQAGGAYACPMHPWETSVSPADCPICEMAMVATGQGPDRPGAEPAALLSVPREAVMRTGERALAYLEAEPGLYRGMEVEVGPLAGDAAGEQFYPVLAGLSEGQQVVTRGNFVIDSQMQLAGKPSLFHARGMQGGMPGHGGHGMHGGQAEHGDHAASGHDVEHAPAAQESKPGLADPSDEKQTLCPVMGGEIDPEVYTDVHGVRVYFCCPPCIKRFRDDLDKYLDKLPAGMQARIREGRAAEEGADQ